MNAHYEPKISNMSHAKESWYRYRDAMSASIRLIRISGVLFLALVTSSCQSRGVTKECPYNAGVRTEQQWLDAVHFPYIAPEDRKERILKEFNRLEVGSTTNEVIAALGEPDYETVINPKSPKRSCSYEFHYHVEKPNLAVNVLHDKQVGVYFSPKGKAFWIVSNVNGQIEKGGVSKDED